MKKKVLAIVILLVMLASIPVGVFLVKKRQEIQLRAAPATVLSLIPDLEDYDVGEIFTVIVNVNTGDNVIMSADIILIYDPAVLEAISVTMGSFLENAQEAQKIIDNDVGKITYSPYTFLQYAKQGEGTLASISFKGKAPGTSAVIFDEYQTHVFGIPENTDVLAGTVSGSYLITAAQLTPTPTPTTGITDTPTPTPTDGVGGPPTTTPTPTTTEDGDGVGGDDEPTATPTPTTAAGAASTPTPTVSEELPESGNPVPTLLFLIVGGAILGLSFFRVLLY